jgi:hypothetical protein
LGEAAIEGRGARRGGRCARLASDVPAKVAPTPPAITKNAMKGGNNRRRMGTS